MMVLYTHNDGIYNSCESQCYQVTKVMLDCLGAQCWRVVFEQHTPLFKQYARNTALPSSTTYICMCTRTHAQLMIALLYKLEKAYVSASLSLSGH